MMQPLRLATQWNDIQAAAATINNTGTKPNFAARIPYRTGGGALTSLALSFYNWYLAAASTGGLTNTGNSYEITGANIEYNGVVVPLTFSGAAGRVIANGESDVLTDEIPASAFGVSSIPNNALIYIKHKGFVTGSQPTPYSGRTVNVEASGQALFYNSAATTINNFNGAGAMTSSGTAPSQLSYTIMPVVVGRHVSASATALVARGDSLTATSSWFSALTRLFPEQPASFSMAVGSSKSAAGTADARLTNYYKYATIGAVLYGGNDFSTNGLNATVAYVKGVVDLIVSQMKAQGVKKVGVGKQLMVTTSTDGWLTEANQTVPAGWQAGGIPDQYNASVASSGYDFVLSFNSVRGTDPFKWKAANPSLTPDGAHPSLEGDAVMAAEVLPTFQAVIASLRRGGMARKLTRRLTTAITSSTLTKPLRFSHG